MITFLLFTVASLAFGYMMWSTARTEVAKARNETAQVREACDAWREIAADWQAIAERSLPPVPVGDLEWARLRKAVGL